jgi:hypothetical protein
MGEAAKQRLRELVSNGRSDFHQVACSCPLGTEGTDACNFGRRCGTSRIKNHRSWFVNRTRPCSRRLKTIN